MKKIIKIVLTTCLSFMLVFTVCSNKSVVEATSNAVDTPYLKFEAINSGEKVTIQANSYLASGYEYSTDGNTWTSIDSSTSINNATIYIRKTTGTSTSSAKFLFGNVDLGCDTKVSGNILSLLNSDNPSNATLGVYCFHGLFGYADHYSHSATGHLVDASGLLMPSTVSTHCFSEAFRNCTSLKKAPDLPAELVKEYCYEQMFQGCTSLEAAPEIMATTLERDACVSMFYGCTSLKSSPALHATTLLNQRCCISMFEGCTSLEVAPALPATKLNQSCYSSMFSGCTSLETAPTLPATALANQCYSGMFSGCTALETAPSLPATTLASDCYKQMFKDCTSLNIKNGDTGITWDIDAFDATNASDMFTGCTNVDFDGNGSLVPTANTTYYLTILKATLDFDTNGGSSVSSIDTKKGNTYGDLPTPTKSGYTFGGWYLDSALTTKVSSTDTIDSTGNITLYAKWVDNSSSNTSKTNTNTSTSSKTSSSTTTTATTNSTNKYTAPNTCGD